MSSKEFEVNGTEYKIMLTDQVVGHVNNLKNLYNAAYEDPESFEDVSSEISSTITDIASTVDPEVEDSDLDGLIQEIIKAVDNKAAEIEKELATKEKPTKKAKSKIAAMGGYILPPEIFEILKKTKRGKGGEVWLADAIAVLGKTRPMYIKIVDGAYRDTGTKEAWLKTNIALALEDKALKTEMRKYIKSLL